MESLTSQSWFWWAVALVVGVPVLLVALGEWQAALARRGNALARPVGLLRNFALPAGALLILLTQGSGLSAEATWVRIVATIFGMLLIVFVLSSLNATMFTDAVRGTWRERMPRIFVDIARLVLIAVGAAILFSWVWGADVGGLFAALGVGSIVIGLALQNAVGGVISGLLLLFEQPFTIGDWLDTGSVSGRVVEVNWRAVHIRTSRGTQVVPNASLAGASFTNLSRPPHQYVESVTTTFGTDDPPLRVFALLNSVAADLPQVRGGGVPSSRTAGAGEYSTSLPLDTVAQSGAAEAAFRTRLWYAARRAGLHLDGAEPDPATMRVEATAGLAVVAPSLLLDTAEQEHLADEVDIEQYADGERVEVQGTVPDGLRFVLSGGLALVADLPERGIVDAGTMEAGDYIGHTVLTREPALATALAVGEVTVLRVPRDEMDRLLLAKPRLSAEIGRNLDERRAHARSRFEAVDVVVDSDSDGAADGGGGEPHPVRSGSV